MLIAIDASRAAHVHRTGTEGYNLSIIRALIALEQDHRYILYFRDEPPHNLLPAYPNVEYQVIRRARLWTHTALGPAVRRARPDVFFVPAHVIPWPGLGMGPAVVTIHDLGYLRFPGSHPLIDRIYLDWSTRHSTSVARRVIAVSQATADDLVDLSGVSRQKIRVVYSGVDVGMAAAPLPERFGIPGPYILHVGSIHSRKNLVRLVEAFALVKDTLDDLSLVLAGHPGWEYDRLLEKIDELGLAERVILPGYVSDEERSALYQGAGAYAFPSLYEGFGFPVLEAMAYGIPVVCSNTSSLPELAAGAALMVDPLDTQGLADAIKRLLVEETLRRDLVQRGLRRVELFSWESCARSTLDVLIEAAGV